MNITNAQLVKAFQSLKAMPALKKAPKGVYALAKNLAALQAEITPLETTTRTIWKNHFGAATNVDPTHPKWQEYQAEIRALDTLHLEVPVHQFCISDLNLDENDIHHEHLAAIGFMIADF